MPDTFTEIERAILHIVQQDLPDSTTPYADIARQTGTDEETVLNLLRRLHDDGAIRRFGASIKHQKTAWKHNAMVAWLVPGNDPALLDAAGEYAASLNNVSHCYYRPSAAADWPYALYTMVHGRTENECRDVIATIQEKTGLAEYALLESLKELKKISMTYF